MHKRALGLAVVVGIAVPALGQTPYQGHGVGSVAPEVLARYAPKPLPADVASHIQTLMDVRAPGMGVPTADGARLFFGWGVTGTPQVWRLDGPDRFPVQLTGGQDRTSLAGLTPDGRFVVVQRDRNGEENPGLYLVPADGGAPVAVQHEPGVQTFFDFVSRDGEWIYFHANDQKADAYAVYRWSPRTKARETILAEPGLWAVADHRDDGRLLLQKSTGALSSEYSEWDPATKVLSPVIGQGEAVEYQVRYGAAPGQFLVLTPRQGEFRRLYTLTHGGSLAPATPEMKWDVSGFDIDDARTRILYTVNEGGYTRLAALDARTLAALVLPELPPDADHVYAGTTTPNGRFTTFGVETAKAPRTSYVYDWAKGTLTRWVVPSAPEVDTRAFAAATLETYPSRDGTPIPAFVRRPARCEPQPCPVIVEFHGGPEGQAQPGFSTYAQIFVDAGFVFVEPNVRGSDGYGKTWLDADNGPKRLAILSDIADAAAWARKTFAANGREPKVGVMGGSYGGYSTLIAMTKLAGAYDAGVSIVGISNLVTFLENTAPYRRILRTTEYGDPAKDRDALVELSPVTHIARLKAPLLVEAGATDPRVPVGEAVQMYEAALKTGVPTELVIFADEGHGAGRRDNQVLMVGHALHWMDEYLKGEAAGATAPVGGR
jgi:dipeptidyl aminopeptidase/acylaminoacyl peptidase